MADHGEAFMVEEEPASPATRLFHSPKLECFVVAIMGCKVKVDVDVVKAKAIQTLPNVPRLSSVLVKDEKLGAMTWTPTTLNIENHIICPDIDNDMNSTDEFVQSYIASLTAKPMDMSKPLWEVHILNVKTSDNSNSTAIFRIHHSVGDGISLISILLALTRKTSDPESLPTIPSKKPKLVKHNSSPLIQFFSAIWAIIMLIINTMIDVTLFLATIVFLKDTQSPLTGGPGIERTHKRIIHRSVSMDDLKFVKTATNATINDVILGVTEAALSRYLNRKYASKNEQMKRGTKKNSLPKNIRMRASLMFNIRPSPGLQVLADMMKRKSRAKWGNKIGYSLLPLKIALLDDPLNYIREAQAMVNRKKLSLESRFSYAAANLIRKLLGVKVAAAVTYKVLVNTTLCLSNVVGPQEEISFFGHPITYIAPSVHGMPHALLIHFQSYINKMTVVFTYDPSVIPDPHQLFDDIEESLKNIKDAAIKRRLEKGAEP